MSRLTDLMAKKRTAQIAKMEGRTIDTADVDRELADVGYRPTRERRKMRGARLNVTGHARRRMRERGANVSIAMSIWYNGETVSDKVDGHDLFVVTNRSLANMTAGSRKALEKWVGWGVIVGPPHEDDERRRPVLVTFKRVRGLSRRMR